MIRLQRVPSWEEMQSKAIPTCLSSQLREVEVVYYSGLEAELLMVKYLLLNSKALSKLHFKESACEVQKIAEEVQRIPVCPEHVRLYTDHEFQNI